MAALAFTEIPLVIKEYAYEASGAGGGTRTLTVSPPPDFESGASTDSAIPANEPLYKITVEKERDYPLKNIFPARLASYLINVHL